MNYKHFTFIASWILIGLSLYLLIEDKSNRAHLIAGITTLLGFLLNLLSYLKKT